MPLLSPPGKSQAEEPSGRIPQLEDVCPEGSTYDRLPMTHHCLLNDGRLLMRSESACHISSFGICAPVVSHAAALATISLISVISLPEKARAMDLGCDWIAYRIDFNFRRYGATEKEMAVWWDYDRRTIKNTCNLTYKEYYYGRGKRKKEQKVIQRETGNVQHENGLTDPANVEPDPDWAGDTRKRILDGKGEKEVAVNHNPNRLAPYGASTCAEIKPAPNRGTIDWDWVTVRNKCSYPLKVLTCYYDKGEDARCATHNKNATWGLSGTINPGGMVTSVATSKQWPWSVKVIVCDMRDGNNLLCVPPERLAK